MRCSPVRRALRPAWNDSLRCGPCEPDKVTLDLPAPAAGVLSQILKTERQEVALGEPLGRIEMLTAEITPAPRSEAAQPSGALPSAERPLIEPDRSLSAQWGAE